MKKYILLMITAMFLVAGCVTDQPISDDERTKQSAQDRIPNDQLLGATQRTENKHLLEPKTLASPPLLKTNPPISQKSILPTSLDIPAIRLHTAVEQVGIMSDGKMGVPKAFDRVGLLQPATLPGENGNAVMDGHFDHYTGPAVFYRLRKLKQGDTVLVSDKSGNKLTFVVKSVESFKTKEAPLEKIFGYADKPQLNLITCDGKFNRKTKEHARRLVVFTELLP